MGFRKGLYFDLYYFLFILTIFIIVLLCLSFIFIRDDANLFYRHRDLVTLKQNVSSELINIHSWLCTNKLSLNIEKEKILLSSIQDKRKFQLTLSLL